MIDEQPPQESMKLSQLEDAFRSASLVFDRNVTGPSGGSLAHLEYYLKEGPEGSAFGKVRVYRDHLTDMRGRKIMSYGAMGLEKPENVLVSAATVIVYAPDATYYENLAQVVAKQCDKVGKYEVAFAGRSNPTSNDAYFGVIVDEVGNVVNAIVTLQNAYKAFQTAKGMEEERLGSVVRDAIQKVGQ